MSAPAATFVDSLSGLCKGPDQAFYSHLAGAMIQIGHYGVIDKQSQVATGVTGYSQDAAPRP